ncbi:L-fucose:H+ symporter permease [Novosphingobium sp. SG720]|uniref:L-fucose:H+ symporter permease n=1 Tax=Novosphingobium sp. SG720 TaxID=2586998 RepID=UPI0014474A83|nr:L-fucose:H+ symporter permease [Novosphingobium sp. SG720]NKJ42234.1 FHS family L-fucose permease-like MFS transporter [Novosphingobium sp. SG720]
MHTAPQAGSDPAKAGPADEGHSGAGGFILPGFGVAFALVVSLFFLWALANNLNDILIRQFQKALGLNRAEAGFIQFVFYIGYFTMALPAGIIMRRYGYRAGILVGLALYAVGAFLFYPASLARTFSLFLAALYAIAAGAAFLETAANPCIAAFGAPAAASQRLNLAQAFNGIGGVVAPLIGGLFIFSGVEHSSAALAAMSAAQRAAYRASEAQTVQVPYLVLGLAVLLVGLAFVFAPLPRLQTGAAAPLQAGAARRLLARPKLRRAVIAQFLYNGAQVGIWSFFIDFAKDALPTITEREAAYLLSFSLVLFMLGRFAGAALMIRFRPAVLLVGYAVVNMVLMALAVLSGGTVAVAALILSSFFMSIMFPTIFALGIEDLGPLMPLGASCLVMAVVGGAVVPPLMGQIALHAGSLHPALVLPLLCFAGVAFFARRLGERVAVA